MRNVLAYLSGPAAVVLVAAGTAACSSSSSTATTDSGATDAGTDAHRADAAKHDAAHTDAQAGPDATGHDGGTHDATTDVTTPHDAAADVVVARVPVSITGTTDTTFVTESAMFAAIEMQLSGAPLAESFGRSLSGYSRDYPTPNIYFPPGGGAPTLDLVGFGTAVESFEYARQPLANVAFESGAGTSFLFAPLVNPTSVTGSAALSLLIPRIQHFAMGSNAAPTYVEAVDGTDPINRLGWPGLWPTLHPYVSFSPAIVPAQTTNAQCSIGTDDTPGSAGGAVLALDYECDFNSLHLTSRATQITSTISPGASGWASWAYAERTLDYLQTMHDSAGNAIATVGAADLANVGASGNTVVGTPVNPAVTAAAGTYLGDSSIEGFQAEELIDLVDNQAQQWLTQLTTTDGVTLSGFASVQAALQYDYAAPLRWFPGAIAVTESADASGYPKPSGYAITSASSTLFDQLGLAGAYATAYTLTDDANVTVGGSQPVLALFDGDPFPTQNQTADGAATLHDRALGMLRVLLVNLDRLHVDPTSGLLVDDVTFTGATATRGTTVATPSVAYSIVALRAVRRALGDQLTAYGNTTPDTAVAGVTTVLDGAGYPLTGAPGGATTVTDRIDAILTSEAKLLLNKLTAADGHAYAGWDVATGATTSTDDSLDAYTAAIRGLVSAYQSTGDTTYRDRAVAVFTRMDSVFFDPAALLYMSSPIPASAVSYTPRRFAMLEGALRDIYVVAGSQPGQAVLGSLVQARLARLLKLVLNGWDDLDGNQIVDYGTECLTVKAAPGSGSIQVGFGGLQMAERARSGELGETCTTDAGVCDLAALTGQTYTPDREHDCVPEISAAQLPSGLANQVTFHR